MGFAAGGGEGEDGGEDFLGIRTVSRVDGSGPVGTALVGTVGAGLVPGGGDGLNLPSGK